MKKSVFDNKKNNFNSMYLSFPLLLVALIFAMMIINDTENSAAAVDCKSYNQINYDQPKVVQQAEPVPVVEPVLEVEKKWEPIYTENTSSYLPDFNTDNIILVDVQSGEVLYEKNSNQIVHPASLTKIMTVLVAVENIDNLDDTFTMTQKIIDDLIAQDASRAGFKDGEKVTIRDLLYGAMLPSGADATVGLAQYVSGSEEEFVKLMNKKADELGLENTNFTNSSGLHNDNLYTTARDMSIVVNEAMQNNLVCEVMSTHSYRTKSTEQNPDGVLLNSTVFRKIYGTETEKVMILGGKTGFTNQAKNCLATFAVKDAKEYVLVQMGAEGSDLVSEEALELYELLNK